MPFTFIMPDWDDYLDKDFDFEKDDFSASTKASRNDIYLHELLGNDVPYDGILVSLAQIMKGKGALKGIRQNTNSPKIRELMRIPPKLQIIGDCGAFSYKDKKEPVFTPEQAAKLYHDLGFDIGASVDHMAIPEILELDEKGNTVKIVVKDKKGNQKEETKKIKLSDEDQKARVQLTVNNAKAFIDEVRKKEYNFIPLGSIQGITVEDYVDGFKQYIDFGYEQIAIGSLVPKNDEEIRAILEAIGKEYHKLSDEKKSLIKIHLFGVIRPNLFQCYKDNGVTSFDSASYFRKAWLRSDNNYLSADNKWYAALRVPQSMLPKNKKALETKKLDLNKIRSLELKVLKLLADYDKDKATLDNVLSHLLEYDNFFDRLTEDGDKIREAYKRTLEDKPWKNCNCKICKEIGIQVVIFRGFNRNKRRGFHNTFVFYHNLKNSKQSS